MSDNVIELNTFTAAQYWEAQADMWHANYADEHKENQRLVSANNELRRKMAWYKRALEAIQEQASAVLKETGD